MYISTAANLPLAHLLIGAEGLFFVFPSMLGTATALGTKRVFITVHYPASRLLEFWRLDNGHS